MDGAGKNGDSWQKTKADCVANLIFLYPDIKPSDMNTIVNSIFNLLKVTDKVEAQHTKKRPPKKRSENQKERRRETRHAKNEIKKAERQQREEEARQEKARQTPPAAGQQKQETEDAAAPRFYPKMTPTIVDVDKRR